MIDRTIIILIFIFQINPISCQIDLDSLDIEMNIETVLLRFANSENTVPDIEKIAQSSSFELLQLSSGIDSLKDRGFLKKSDTILFNPIARKYIDSLTKGGTVMVGNTFSNSTFTTNKSNDNNTIIFNGNTVNNKSEVEIHAQNDINITDNIFTDTTQAYINDTKKSNFESEKVAIKKSRSNIADKPDSYKREFLNNSSESNFKTIWNDSVWSKVIAILIATLIISFIPFLYSKFISAVRFRRKSYYDIKYLLNNTRKGGPVEYKNWLVGYKAHGGKVSTSKSSKKKNFDDLRIIDKHIFLNPFYGSESLDFIVMKKGKVSYLEDSIGHNTLYFMEDFTSTNSNPLNV